MALALADKALAHLVSDPKSVEQERGVTRVTPLAYSGMDWCKHPFVYFEMESGNMARLSTHDETADPATATHGNRLRVVILFYVIPKYKKNIQDGYIFVKCIFFL